MTPQERVKAFLELAPLAFGRYWKSRAAKELGKTPNTIRNWRLGNTAPDEAIIALLSIYANRAKKYAKKLESRDTRDNA